jgi:hypothetical protein
MIAASCHILETFGGGHKFHGHSLFGVKSCGAAQKALLILPKLSARRVDVLLENVLGCRWTSSACAPSPAA